MTCEAIHCFDTATVRFAIYPDGFDGPRIIAEISEDALRDLFGARGGGNSLVDACKLHFSLIEARAVERYRSAPSRPVVLAITDFGMPSVQAVEALCA
ncbi:hypothetical protein [Variovorax sp. SRS16]|uniref:hypothetical protein n=1 Tax=Variovorax sp. SRS16 TaxID=282217 RepID=UPI0013A5B4A2|nr:hypothetical protein [Variovorax sp. SRS16]